MEDPTMRRHRNPDPNATPHTLDELPEHRQLNLLWHLAHTLDREHVQELMPSWTIRPCQTGFPETVTSTAIQGDDGRFHLWSEHGMICGSRPKKAKHADPWRHEQLVSAWTDGTRYRTQPFQDAERATELTRHKWLVQPTSEPVPADTVAPKQRCPGGVGHKWPSYINQKGARGQVRRQLIDALGPRCGICGKHGQFIDHDPFTGLVRGLLCHYCNTNVDDCPHKEGCVFGDYLNDPPAVGLGMVYPDLGKTYARTVEKAEEHGWDPMLFAEVRKRRSPKGWRSQTLSLW